MSQYWLLVQTKKNIPEINYQKGSDLTLGRQLNITCVYIHCKTSCPVKNKVQIQQLTHIWPD